MEQYSIERAKHFLSEILRVANSKSPAMFSGQASDPLLIIAEAFAVISAMIDKQVTQLPEAVATELPGLFGLHPVFARPAQAFLSVSHHPKNKSPFEKLPEKARFELKSNSSPKPIPFFSKSALDVFDSGQIFLEIAPDKIIFGLEKFPEISKLPLFFEFEHFTRLPKRNLKWSYSSGSNWIPVSPRDGTQNLSQSGIVEFDFSNERPQTTAVEGVVAYWIRVEFDEEIELVPLRKIRNNVILIENYQELVDFVVGSSNGHPNQSLELPEGQLAGPLVVEVEFKDKKQREEWKEVDSFFLSQRHSHDFRYDAKTHSLVFGDNVKGQVPSAGFDNIRVKNLCLTAGSEGNLPVNSHIQFSDSSTFGKIELLTAPTGGTDCVTRNHLISQLHTSLLNRDRAITLRDFEDLSMKSSPKIGRVFVFGEQDSVVRVLPILKMEYAHDSKFLDLSPHDSDIKLLRDFLDSRRMINSKVIVQKPDYLDLVISVQVFANSNPTEVQRAIERAIQQYFNPLMREGIEIVPGKSISVEHLHRYLERVPNIFMIRSVKIENTKTGTCLPITHLSAYQLPRIKCQVRAEEMRGQ
jgi:hypothetical protein